MQMPRINPLLAKELRIRMRTWRTFAMISLYLLGLGIFALIYFSAVFSMVRMGYESLAEMGRGLFAFLAFLQSALVVFTGPALVGNAISGERERQTFDLLACTQLTPRSCPGATDRRPQRCGAVDGGQSAPVALSSSWGRFPGKWQCSSWLSSHCLLYRLLGADVFSLFRRTVSAIIYLYALTLFLAEAR